MSGIVVILELVLARAEKADDKQINEGAFGSGSGLPFQGTTIGLSSQVVR
jgi:hypothetical protein